MSEPLQPGDLCIIINHPHVGVVGARYVGRTVVLLGIADGHGGGYPPYWRCSGLPPGFLVGQVCLRKIPPDRMLDARMHSTPVTDDEKVTV